MKIEPSTLLTFSNLSSLTGTFQTAQRLRSLFFFFFWVGWLPRACHLFILFLKVKNRVFPRFKNVIYYSGKGFRKNFSLSFIFKVSFCIIWKSSTEYTKMMYRHLFSASFLLLFCELCNWKKEINFKTRTQQWKSPSI